MKEHHTSSPFRAPYSLWKGAARVALVAGLTLIAVTLLSACGDGAQATQSLVSKPASTATPEPTPIPTATPEPTPVSTAMPEPTPIPTATPEPTPVSTAMPDSLDGDCAGALTKGHSLEKILTDEKLMRCLHERLRTESTPIPAATPEPTPIPIVTPEPAPVSSLTPIPTATPEPTLVSSPTTIPTETPEPTPISTAMPEPTPVSSPTPDSLDGDCEGVLTKGTHRRKYSQMKN